LEPKYKSYKTKQKTKNGKKEEEKNKAGQPLGRPGKD
jgi:hypothetical protein